MATYKVLQDIEAEDKILGPLTLKQFVFGGITLALGGIGYFIASNTHIAAFVPFLIPMIPFGFLAAPIGRDQPNDIWLAARLRFLFKPKTRTWDQTGMQEFVTITAPKKEEHVYTDGLNRDQVVSRLKALANTVDSRGWAVKNSNLNLATVTANEVSDDRLIKPSEIPQQVQDVDVHASDDIFDNNANAVSQHFNKLMDDKAQAAKLEAIARMDEAKKEQVIAETKKLDSSEEAFLQALHKKQDRLGVHHEDATKKPVAPSSAALQADTQPAVSTEKQEVVQDKKEQTAAEDRAKINQLADNDAFSVATIQEQANRPKAADLDDGFEVDLH